MQFTCLSAISELFLKALKDSGVERHVGRPGICLVDGLEKMKVGEVSMETGVFPQEFVKERSLPSNKSGAKVRVFKRGKKGPLVPSLAKLSSESTENSRYSPNGKCKFASELSQKEDFSDRFYRPRHVERHGQKCRLRRTWHARKG